MKASRDLVTREECIDKAVRRSGLANVLIAVWYFNPEGCRRYELPDPAPISAAYTTPACVGIMATVRRFFRHFYYEGKD